MTLKLCLYRPGLGAFYLGKAPCISINFNHSINHTQWIKPRVKLNFLKQNFDPTQISLKASQETSHGDPSHNHVDVVMLSPSTHACYFCHLPPTFFLLATADICCLFSFISNPSHTVLGTRVKSEHWMEKEVYHDIANGFKVSLGLNWEWLNFSFPLFF